MPGFYQRHKRTIKKVVRGVGYGYQALQLAQKVASLVNVEYKHFDHIQSGTQGNTGSVALVSGIANGTGVSERVGNSIALKNAYMKLAIQATGPEGTKTRTRVILFEDKNSNSGTAPTVAQLLVSDTMMSFLNKDNSRRFKVLFDKQFMLSQFDNNQLTLKRYFTFGGRGRRNGKPSVWQKHITWTDTDAGDTDRGHLYLYTLSDQGTYEPTIDCSIRLNYVDN